MKNTLRFDHDARCIVMDRTFYKNSSNIRFEEYSMLQRARQDYPTYSKQRNSANSKNGGKEYDYTEQSNADAQLPEGRRNQLQRIFTEDRNQFGLDLCAHVQKSESDRRASELLYVRSRNSLSSTI